MAYTQITYDTDGDVGVLTLNRPAKLNAWTHTMSEELIEAIIAANADPAIGALVLTGAGRGFCARSARQRAKRATRVFMGKSVTRMRYVPGRTGQASAGPLRV